MRKARTVRTAWKTSAVRAVEADTSGRRALRLSGGSSEDGYWSHGGEEEGE